MHTLKAKDLKKSYKKTQILHGINLEVETGQVVGLLGPNGAGKTTTFYMVCGLVEPTSGEIFFDDENVTSYPLHKRAIMGIGYLPQEASIFKDLTVEENLQIAAELAFKDDKKKQSRRIETLLEQFNIEHIRRRKGLNLSGGERRRAEIARALIAEPKFILLDEPFAGVDPIAVMDIQQIINHLKKENIGVLITDHSVRETLSICDYAYVLKDGLILAEGDALSIANDEQVITHYLGKDFSL
jgi:lipopolysaccharide export system ATP-binding protein